MRFSLLAALLAVISFLAGCATPERLIRVGGGDAALTGFIAPVQETFEEENGIPLVIVRGTPGRELADLLRGELDAVVSTVPLEELVREAAREHPDVGKAALREVQIGKNQTVVFLNKGITLRKLTKKQLREIFTGRITNWKRLGGANRHIVVVWNPGAAAENELFAAEVLHGDPVAAGFRPAGSAEEVRKIVMATPGAVGIGPKALVASVVRVPKSPTVASTVVLITRGEPSPRMQRLIELLKDVAFIP